MLSSEPATGPSFTVAAEAPGTQRRGGRPLGTGLSQSSRPQETLGVRD